MSYQDIMYGSQPHATDFDCFFAFGRQQFEEALAASGIEQGDLRHAGAGLYGTASGLRAYLAALTASSTDRVRDQCSPQEVYNFEFDNHECGYTGSDEDAWKIVVSIFGEDRAAEVARREYGWVVEAIA